MFGWFTACCPCDPAAKEWIERRLAWLSRQFPSNVFTDRPLVLPTPEFFPEPCEPTKKSAKELLARICGFMGVSTNRVVLKLQRDTHKTLLVNDKGDYVPLQPAGTYERVHHRYVITLDADQLYQPAHLTTTMAHELAHARLLGEGRTRYGRYDSEILTDLTACFLGFGIFLANSPRVWKSDFSKWPGTEYNKPGYMTPPMYGYMLAHLAWFQNQRKPSWAQHLAPCVINDFRDATRFLFKTEDSTFRPRRLATRPLGEPSEWDS